ncbi:hypothetical protein [Croceimicrobium hydrocarbonivorans]|uniref:Uncharacterized protein n=1 Tax=Croceimicrobium hydrocarbonivorans TaxID=2761580 RepID=A0A7H0VB55_9FLAO|nr:hypothetical protein [Croceimicrobium hydrocarbonivorans]QNR22953.1 hypothetical protein H4K34_11245 [Croceimicrobium hydrocarbonivorans]QNR22996.1 hypothetical protein H4K34_11460 [Croceimicrobium hydrocarbonivorans]
MQLTPQELSIRLAEEPLLFAKVATDNNPEDISQKLMDEGIINGPARNPELLDLILQVAPQMNPSQLIFIFDVPFSYNPDNEASDAGFLETFSVVADRKGLTPDKATWSTLYPTSAASLGEAQSDFVEGLEYPPITSTQNLPLSRCQVCAIRRVKTLLLVGIALLLVIILIKKW